MPSAPTETVFVGQRLRGRALPYRAGRHVELAAVARAGDDAVLDTRHGAGLVRADGGERLEVPGGGLGDDDLEGLEDLAAADRDLGRGDGVRRGGRRRGCGGGGRGGGARGALDGILGRPRRRRR